MAVVRPGPSPPGPALDNSPVEFGISRVPCKMCKYMPRAYDSDVSTRLSPYRFVSYCFPHQSTGSAHAIGDFGAPYRACIHFGESTTGHLTMSGSSLEGRGGRLTLPRRGLSPPTSSAATGDVWTSPGPYHQTYRAVELSSPVRSCIAVDLKRAHVAAPKSSTIDTGPL